MSQRVVRRGRWTYQVHRYDGPGWVLDDGKARLEFDPKYDGADGCWMLGHEPVDRYLDNAMAWVEVDVDSRAAR